MIVALRNEKGSYNIRARLKSVSDIVALRNEKGSYNEEIMSAPLRDIVALRNEKGSYNLAGTEVSALLDCSTAK